MPHRTFDRTEVRCPQLGHEVTFGYCRSLSEGLPCAKALTCYERRFPVEAYFRRVLKAETFHRIFVEPGEPRYDQIMRTIKEAADRVGD